ncbi:oxaloacetate decarboxylase [Pseudacidovorax sp. RU35E]|uniref:isocitrate lyase/PEP mutase family protein n=1 Tax=Pseudacidovorax sp. RU35E TaxID=1907403 RepID=UPI000954192D|nr:oxaloacetate decarboxylase [Pseudacidovorax sp. RU35E]SIQ51655.1 2-Methylisocitrate lyase, PEP mutase family [Pseudacidovorax sp. RU35E]
MTTHDETLNRRLRRQLVPGAGLMMPGAANSLTARLIEAAGHPLLMVSGAAVANTFLGVPDIGLSSVTELALHVDAIRDAVDIPIVVDADTGFGNALNVRRTVRTLERAGANAIMLEDQTYPKRCGHFDGKSVVPAAEMVAKIHAAVDARNDADLVILARTDARAVEGLEAAMQRARDYLDAGADMLFIEAPLSRDELLAIPREVPGLHLCNMVVGGRTPLLPREELARAGFAAICYANAALQASALAMRSVLAHLHNHGDVAGVQAQLMSFAERQSMLGAEDYVELARRYA